MEVGYVSDSDCDPEWWVESLGLFREDQIIIPMGKDLTSNIINAAQKAMCNQFTDVCGFQNITSPDDDVKNFHPVAPDKRSVQILHSGMLNCIIVVLLLLLFYFYL